jgi:Na+(H+)/acetate symporter ActP
VVTPGDDPVLARRARFARAADAGQKLGYGLIVLAVAGFVVGLVVGFDNRAVTAVVGVALAATAVTLLPAIILGFAVKAAQKEDGQREEREGNGEGGAR